MDTYNASKICAPLALLRSAQKISRRRLLDVCGFQCLICIIYRMSTGLLHVDIDVWTKLPRPMDFHVNVDAWLGYSFFHVNFSGSHHWMGHGVNKTRGLFLSCFTYCNVTKPDVTRPSLKTRDALLPSACWWGLIFVMLQRISKTDFQVFFWGFLFEC